MTTKLLVIAVGSVFVGRGINFNSSMAAGLIDAVGILLPANCVRLQFGAAADATQAALTLSGSKILKPVAEKSPLRSGIVGTVVVVVDAVRCR